MTQAIPSQDLVAKDLHGYEWRFKHIFRGKNAEIFCFDVVFVLIFFVLFLCYFFLLFITLA